MRLIRRRLILLIIVIQVMLMSPEVMHAEYTFHSVDTFPGPISRILFGDTDHNGFMELFTFRETGYFYGQLEIYERNSEDRYSLAKIIPSYTIPFAIGDGDQDGLSDVCVIAWFNEGLSRKYSFMESATQYEFPINTVNNMDKFYFDNEEKAMYMSGHGQYIDLDKDGRNELVTNFTVYGFDRFHTGLAVLEYTADNTLMLKNLLLPFNQRGFDVYDFAIGDTDQDGNMEVAFCTNNGYPYIYKALPDNRFELVWSGDHHSAIWATEIADYNNNGIPEIVFAGQWGYYPIVKFYVYEWNGQTYEQIQYIENSIPHFMWLRDSLCSGDIDGDGIPELISATSVIDIFKCNANGQLQRINRIHDSEIGNDTVFVYSRDLNGNGYSEIIYTAYQQELSQSVIKIIEIDPASAPGPPVPTPTPTPVPIPVVPANIEYQARSVGNTFSYGLPFRLFTESVNPFAPQEALVLIALECSGMLWFYPSWSAWPDIEYLRTTIPTGIDYQILFEFEWPQMTGWGEATLWSLVWDAASYQMISIYNWPFTFGEGY